MFAAPRFLRPGRAASAAVAGLLVAGLVAAGGLSPAAAEVAAPAPGVSAKPGGPLSARLQDLAAPGTRSAPPADQGAAVGVPPTGAGSLLRRGGRILVNLVVDRPEVIVTAASVADAELVATGIDGVTATLAIWPTQLGALAAVSGLRSVHEVLAPELRGASAPVRGAGVGRRAAACPSGVVSAGDTQLKAALARNTYGVNGAGVTVGVISDSFKAEVSAYNADIASGDLPGAGNPCGHTTAVKILSDYLAANASDEGRAMTQIVHDLAPAARLLFASGFNGDIDFANQIRALRDAGATVIVDDLGYFNELMFQDGPIAAAVNEVTADGVSYFSAAGNAELSVGGKSVGSYETAAYRSSTCPALFAADYTCHDFDPGAGATPYDTITIPSGGKVILSTGWNQPAYGVTVDLDVYLYDPIANKVVAGSHNDNLRHGQPTELLGYENASGSSRQLRIVIGRYRTAGTPGNPRFKFIFQDSDVDAVQWKTNAGGDVFGPTIYGHSAATAAASVAATPADNAGQIESFSSRGPALYCWSPVSGTTASAPLSPCVSEQVDLAATDGVSTTLPGGSGLNPFFGTSAAAPHAAAVAALFRQKQPCASGPEVLATMKANAVLIAGYGEAAQGAGLVHALDTVADAVACVGTPSAPSAPIVVSAGAARATVAWAPPVTLGGGTLTGYTLQVLGVTGAVISSTAYGTATTQVLTALPAGAYRFRVRAEAGTASPYSPRSAVTIPPFRTVDAFTIRQFLDFANRTPTANERRDWNARIVDGSATPAARVLRSTLFSAWGPAVDPITRMFYAALGRAPDTAGLNAWLPQRRSGLSVAAMGSYFAASSEFKTRYGTLTNRQFVSQVYLNVRGVVGPVSTIDYFTSALDRKDLSRGSFLTTLSEDAAHRDRRSGEVAAVSLHFAMLRRAPTSAEIGTWRVSAMANRTALANALLASAAYDART